MEALRVKVGAIFMVFGLFGCSNEIENQQVTVRGNVYLIPKTDRPKFDRERLAPLYVHAYPKSQSTQSYTRLWYQHENYDTLSRLNIPDIFGIIEGDEQRIREQLREFVAGDVTVFCQKRGYGSGLHYTCGFRVLDQNVSWSVNFDEQFIDQAPLIKAEILKKLKSYRDAANAK